MLSSLAADGNGGGTQFSEDVVKSTTDLWETCSWKAWNRPGNNNDDDGPHDDLEDEVAEFEAQLRCPTTPVSADDSLYEESNTAGTSEPPKKKGRGAYSDMNERFSKSTEKDGKITATCNHCSTT
ncbi:hypothetical protein RvY_06922 [Ramazzottius varieornatus]|uniref:Uncharacterized protein n=1 Tax=Ramazzottius varieornatus TaxID=947166 RepID=A0A1D1V0A6_RAMVA|nr:hypothetical protein RvY_06922 [Ramazzottius varieornatus]